MIEASDVAQVDALFATESVGIALLDRELRYLRMNATYAELRRSALEEQLDHPLTEGEAPRAGAPLKPLLERARAGERIMGHILEGAGYHMVVDVVPASTGEMFVFAVQSIERRQAENALQVRLRLAELISELSAAFIELPASRIDEGVDEALSVAGVGFGLDRASVLHYEPHRLRLHVSHEWTAPGIPKGAAGRHYDLAENAIFGRLFLERDALVASSLDALPDTAEGAGTRAVLVAMGIRAIAIVPLKVGSELRGMVTFAQVKRDREWTPELVATLRLAAEILANALERKRTDGELRGQLAFEQTYSRLSADLLPGSISGFDGALERALETTSSVLELSRALLLTYPKATEVPRLFQQWHRPDCPGYGPDALRLFEGTTWPASALQAGEVVVTGSDEIPTEAAEARRVLDVASYRLHVLVPLRSGDSTVGVVLLQAAEEPAGGRGILASRARLLVDLIAGAVGRVAAEIERERSREELQRVKNQIELERDFLRQEAKGDPGRRDLIGESPALRQTLEALEAVAITNAAALLIGESGVGKELFARAVHERSRRVDEPLVKVNCAAIPKDLFESEFFGHVRGSFTGAIKDRVGRFELAHRGTLFLDEVGEIPFELQSKLLRVLQEGEFERVGDDRTRKVDVRVVAATNRDLAKDVAQGTFRQDLYYRLSVFPIRVPPLRERPSDIPVLAEHFASLFRRSFGRSDLVLKPEHMSVLTSYDWPGNVRELQHVIERAFILAGRDRPLAIRVDPHAPASVVESSPPTIVTAEELEALSKRSVIAALERAAGRIGGPGGAAELLGMRPSTLRDRMRVLGVTRSR